jgi:N-methylhydantoinase A
VLQIARSYVPGGLGGWVIYNKSLPMAPLALTIEADERVDARGEIVRVLDEAALREALLKLKSAKIEALTVSLINAFANDKHERRIREIAAAALPGVPVSLSSEVVPEMQEYERTVTTVANSYVRPVVQRYVHNLQKKLASRAGRVKLHILRSDGGLASAASAEEYPVNLLMSGPAGGVTGAVWVALQAGFPNLLTVDVGGTSTDVALIMDGVPRLRRETTVSDVTVRASSVDIRSVGAGGGSIAHVPELTKALRVGPNDSLRAQLCVLSRSIMGRCAQEDCDGCKPEGRSNLLHAGVILRHPAWVRHVTGEQLLRSESPASPALGVGGNQQDRGRQRPTPMDSTSEGAY